jgi:hypothetical protein
MWFRPRQALASSALLAVASTSCSLALDFDATSSEPLAESKPFCAQHSGPPAVFCDDFDGEVLGTKWPLVEQTNGSARNDSAASISAPSSLLSIASPVGVRGSVRAVGVVSFASLSTTKVGLRISFSMRVDQFDPTSGAKNIIFDFLYGPLSDFNQIVLNLVSTETAVSVQVAENAQKLSDGTSMYEQYGPFEIKPTIGQWMKVAIDIDIINPQGAGNTLRVRLDDQTALQTSLKLPLKGDKPRLELGVGWVDSETKPTQTWAVRYDDFLVETTAL